MPRCLRCGEGLTRSRRNISEKLYYSLVFKCRSCGLRVGEKHNFLNYFARHTRCPRCGTAEVEKRTTRDRIDKVLKTPISLVQAMLGGTLYHCVFCRIQFYDLRSRPPKSSSEQKASEAWTGEQPRA